LNEPETMRMVFKKHSLEGKDVKKIAEEMNISEYKIKKMLARANEFLSDYDKSEVREYYLDSIDKMKEDFDIMRDKIKKLLDKSEAEGADMKSLSIIREWKSLLELGLKRLGELKSGLTTIKADSINIKQLNMIALQMEEQLFNDNKIVEEEGMLILKEPKPELVDNYHKWKKKKQR